VPLLRNTYKEEPKMELKPILQEYTATEFQALVDKIWAVDLPKHAHNQLINHFDRIVGHPKGADLLFYPDDVTNINDPESVVHEVRDWHDRQGMTAFKQEPVSIPVPSIPNTPVARSLAKVQKIAADVVISERAIETTFDLLGQGIQQLHDQSGGTPDIPVLETNILALEHVQHEAITAVRKFESWKMIVEFAKNDAQRNLAYARSEQAQWQNIAQQVNALQVRYIGRLAAFAQRHRSLHDQAEGLLIQAQKQLMGARSLAQVGSVITASLASVHKRPDVLLEGGPSGLLSSQQIDWLKAIRSVVAEFTWRNTCAEPTDGNLCAAVLRFEFSSRADTQIHAHSVALVELMPLEGQDWLSLAASQSKIEVPFRMGATIVRANPGKMFKGLREVKALVQVYIAPVLGIHESVRVRAVQHDPQLNTFSFATDGAIPMTTCLTAPTTLETSTPEAQTSSRRVGFVQSSPVPILEPMTGEEDVPRFDDYILVFPADSGLDPLYVTLSTSSLARTLALPAHVARA
jgi:hypothetical protein